jgi:hypothetical protein
MTAMRGYTAGETVAAAELAAAGLLRAGVGSTISSQAVFMPAEAKPQGTYVSINVWLDCACKILDLAAFANQMRQQRGWAVATGGGWGSTGRCR